MHAPLQNVGAYRERAQAEHIRALLVEELQMLTLLEGRFKRHSDHGPNEHVHADALPQAIGYVRQAINTLEVITCLPVGGTSS